MGGATDSVVLLFQRQQEQKALMQKVVAIQERLTALSIGTNIDCGSGFRQRSCGFHGLSGRGCDVRDVVQALRGQVQRRRLEPDD